MGQFHVLSRESHFLHEYALRASYEVLGTRNEVPCAEKEFQRDLVVSATCRVPCAQRLVSIRLQPSARRALRHTLYAKWTMSCPRQRLTTASSARDTTRAPIAPDGAKLLPAVS